MGFHLSATLLAFRAFPVLSFLFLLATISSGVFPRRVAIAWAALTVVLTVYVAILGWGPSLTTVGGLTFQVVAQKIVAAVAVATFVYVSVEADRVMRGTRHPEATACHPEERRMRVILRSVFHSDPGRSSSGASDARIAFHPRPTPSGDTRAFVAPLLRMTRMAVASLLAAQNRVRIGAHRPHCRHRAGDQGDQHQHHRHNGEHGRIPALCWKSNG